MLGYLGDYGCCAGVSGHDGGSERVAIDLEPTPGGGDGDVHFAAV